MELRDDHDLRSLVLQELWHRVEADTYPSATMMDHIERLLLPGEVPEYAELLMRKVRPDRYPSIDLINRLVRLCRVYADLERGGSLTAR